MNPPDAVTRLNAALEGRYRIERELGEGGMATVYLAEDLRHDRKVALKVLKPELAAVLGADRFLAEIRTTAKLQHPNILPLFDSGVADSLLFYVMPYVQGQTLRERIEREHQLPVDDAVQIATNVAEALDYAHRQGVIHRDIKPANVLMFDGKPVISDFGIAIAVEGVGRERLTDTGMSLGTPQYMSPEQSTGDQTLGPAADVYALGCVLYEMLIGEPPYTGSTVQAILGKVIVGNFAAAKEVRPSVPANVDASIKKALETLPADRFADARSMALALADPSYGQEASVGPARHPSTLVVASTAAVAAFALAWALFSPQQGPVASPSWLNLSLGEPAGLAGQYSSRVVVSPDGADFVYVGGADGDDDQVLWLKKRGAREPTALAGTEGGLNPAFSPDGQNVAFLVGTPTTALRVVSLRGTPPVDVVRGAFNRYGHSWAPDEKIYVGSDEGLMRVGADGGPLQSFTRVDAQAGETGHISPTALPGGRSILFVVTGTPVTDISRYQIAAADLMTGEHKILVTGIAARYATGHLVYVSAEGTLLATRFDETRLEVKGEPVMVTDGVARERSSGSIDLALSNSGTLVYRSSTTEAQAEIVSVARDGSARVIDPGWVENFRAMSLSPDGTKLAVAIGDSGGSDIWVTQMEPGSADRLTFDGMNNTRPRWLPDGESVSFASGRLEPFQLWVTRADGRGDEPELLLPFPGSASEVAWSPEGRFLVNRTGGAQPGGSDLLSRPADASGEPRVLFGSGRAGNPAFSPDGNWLAYASNQTGSREVYVVRFPDVDSPRTRISTSGGSEPVWAHNGRELFYRNGDNAIVSVDVSMTPTFERGNQRVLFPAAPYQASTSDRLYDVTPDGRFIMLRSITAGRTGEVELVDGFLEVLRRLLPN